MNRYDEVADWYDLYVRTDLDLPYFRGLAKKAVCTLELMAGTGRVSLAMLGATEGAITCVDRSWPMLRRLASKAVGAPRLHCVCADACALPFGTGFDLLVIPFNSVAEITERAAQRHLIDEAWRVLAPGGVFVCTLHNPAVRVRTLDGVTRTHGPFDLPDGCRLTLDVTGNCDPTSGMATSRQRMTLESQSGSVMERRTQTVRFALITRDELESMAIGCGFHLEALHGDYEGAEFDPDRSPFMVWRFKRPAGGAA